MSTLPLIIGFVLTAIMLVGYMLVMVGMRQEDRRRHLAATAPSRTAGLARRVTGCHVRGASLTYGRTAPSRPSPVVPISRAA
ncbi:hypothetical protein GCM10010156_35250 [Planobispora rosea]|uniref:Uncharacterized protein n=1 Tax=Planobispora rosea TaxID=35762 RepID=A0A8J3S0U7_PLARO|nr:hypothetical protein GCM10010156_35250 [Planobispora rosea]GIH81598.1 hypothetical protein Pro02_00060 [Planobispora rosea]